MKRREDRKQSRKNSCATIKKLQCKMIDDEYGQRRKTDRKHSHRILGLAKKPCPKMKQQVVKGRMHIAAGQADDFADTQSHSANRKNFIKPKTVEIQANETNDGGHESQEDADDGVFVRFEELRKKFLAHINKRCPGPAVSINRIGFSAFLARAIMALLSRYYHSQKKEMRCVCC